MPIFTLHTGQIRTSSFPVVPVLVGEFTLHSGQMGTERREHQHQHYICSHSTQVRWGQSRAKMEESRTCSSHSTQVRWGLDGKVKVWTDEVKFTLHSGQMGT